MKKIQESFSLSDQKIRESFSQTDQRIKVTNVNTEDENIDNGSISTDRSETESASDEVNIQGKNAFSITPPSNFFT